MGPSSLSIVATLFMLVTELTPGAFPFEEGAFQATAAETSNARSSPNQSEPAGDSGTVTPSASEETVEEVPQAAPIGSALSPWRSS